MEIFTSEFLWGLCLNGDRRQNIVGVCHCVGINDATPRLVWKRGAPIAVFSWNYDAFSMIGETFPPPLLRHRGCLTLKKGRWRTRILTRHFSSPFELYVWEACRQLPYISTEGKLYHQQILVWSWQGSDSHPVMVKSALSFPSLL